MIPDIGFVVTVLALYVKCIEGHGRLIDPPSRASMWRYGFTLPQNDYDDNQGYCGGQQQLWNRFKGVCGVCGDARSPVPRAHERGGRYYAGTVVKKYREGSFIEVTTQITANHKGWYEFRLCAYDNPSDEDIERDERGNFVEVSHECLNKHLLKVEGGGTRWYLPAPYKIGLYTVKVKLPDGLTCQNCLFQWKWNVANSWGSDPDGESCIGCGEQEQFYACSDISIESSFGSEPVTWSPPNIPRHRPQPEAPKYQPDSPKQKESRPRPKPDLNRSRDNTNHQTSRPFFTYTHSLPGHYIPIKPKLQHPNRYPSWIPALSTKRPSWQSWFNPSRPYVIKQGNKVQSNANSDQSMEVNTSSPNSYRATQIKQTTSNMKNWELPSRKKSSLPLKFWAWLSGRFISKSKPSEEETTTQVPNDAPWWLKLPSSKRVLQWWKIIKKFDNKFRVTTTSMPLPWWVKKSKSSEEDSLPEYYDEKEMDIENNKVVNGISAAASKDRPVKEVVREINPTRTPTPIIPITTKKSTKRNCRPVGRLIQFPNMWLWCNTNCAERHCPNTHCVCSS